MRKLFTSAAIVAVLIGLVVGAQLSAAGNGANPTMQADPASSFEPADVTVTNTDDADSTCEEPVNGEEAAPETVNPVEVDLTLSDDDGVVQMDTVMPDAGGDWTQTYTGLPAGDYQVDGECNDGATAPVGAAPQAVSSFTYAPAFFVVLSPAVTPTTTVAPTVVGPVAASPSFTG